MRATLDIVGDRFQITAGPREGDILREIPGLKFDRRVKTWVAPLSWPTALALSNTYRAALQRTSEVEKWAVEYLTRESDALEIKDRGVDGVIDSGPGLYPFQVDGAGFLRIQEQVLLADEMGTGKTVQAARALQYATGSRYLIVCPNSMKHQWAEELGKWAEVETTVIGGTAAQRRKQFAAYTEGALIINWEGLRGHSRLAGYGSIALSDKEKVPGPLNEIAFDVVIADEAHRAKDPKAKQTRALKAAAGNARYRWALTGTPIADHPGDLWSIMNFVAPHEYPSFSRFRDRYCLQRPTPWATEIIGLNPTHEPEFRRFFEPRFLRRTKAEVLPEMPPKRRTVRRVEMTQKQATAYRKMKKEMIALVDDEFLIAGDPLSQLGRLLQLASGVPELDSDGHLAGFKKPSNKLEAVRDILDESDEPVVVFAESRRLIEFLAEEISEEVGIISGAVDAAARKEVVDGFQRGDIRVCLATLGAGSEGITLTAAPRAVFVQRSFSNIKNKQAEDRIHRIGQDAEFVETIDLVSRGTVEENLLLTVAEKERRLQEVVRDPVFWKEVLDA